MNDVTGADHVHTNISHTNQGYHLLDTNPALTSLANYLEKLFWTCQDLKLFDCCYLLLGSACLLDDKFGEVGCSCIGHVETVTEEEQVAAAFTDTTIRLTMIRDL